MKKTTKLIFVLLMSMTPLHALSETLAIVGDQNALPKNWIGKDGNVRGIMIEVLEEVSKRTDIKFTYSLSPWKRALKMSSEGKGSIIGFSKTTEREKTWDYSVPMYYDELVFVTTKDKKFNFTGIESMGGRSVAIKLGASYGDDFEAARKSGLIKVVETSERKGQLQMLAYNRIDTVLLSPGRVALESVLTQEPYLREHRDDYIILEPPFKLDPNYLGIPKSLNKSHLLPKINAALESMMQDGTHKKIVERVTNEALEELKRMRE